MKNFLIELDNGNSLFIPFNSVTVIETVDESVYSGLGFNLLSSKVIVYKKEEPKPKLDENNSI